MNHSQHMIKGIYKTREFAQAGLSAYLLQVKELQDYFGAEEWCDDSCCATGVSVKYFDVDGKIKEFSS